MQDLVERLASKAAIDQERAAKASRIILGFIAQKAPTDAVEVLLDAIPGSRAAIRRDGEARESGGFGAMAVFNALTGAGLTVDQSQAITRETMRYVRERAGNEAVSRIVGSIPDLDALG
jgi:hypothetical protein